MIPGGNQVIAKDNIIKTTRSGNPLQTTLYIRIRLWSRTSEN